MIDSKTLQKQSIIECKNEEIFKQYVVANYDMTIPAISEKLYHTLRVAKNCTQLSKKIGLDTDLGLTIGLLHDFARFTQWQKYNSYVDYKTQDHADMAVDILFNDNNIDMFSVSSQDKPYIYFSVKYHNKAQIDENKIIEQISKNIIFDLVKIKPCYIDINKALTYCKICRDGDKIDLINRIIAGELNIKYSKNGYTPNCLNRLLNKSYVMIPDISTKLDRIFCFIGFLYDLNFKQSFSLFSLDDFFNSLITNYQKILIPEDLEFLQLIISQSKKNIVEKFNLEIIV